MYSKDSSNNNFPTNFFTIKETEENNGIFDDTEDSSNLNSFINEKISIQEIKNMLRTAKNTSASPDQLPYILLKNVP